MAKEKTDLDLSEGANDPMEQVRELLFGQAKRSTEDRLRAIEDSVEALRAELLERISALEIRLLDLSRDTERGQAASVEAIGGAIAELGANIQKLSLRRKGG